MRAPAAVAVLLALAGAAWAAELPVAEAEMQLAGVLPQNLRPGAAGAGALDLSLAAEGFVCAQAANVTVALAVDDAGAADGVVVVVDPAATFVIPQGAYPPGQGYTGRAAPNATLLVARYAAPGSASQFTVHATVASMEPATACTIDRLADLAAEAKLATKLAQIPPGDPEFHPEHETHGDIAFDKVLKPGESFTWTPTAPGRYPYHDHFQPEVKGLVRVLREAPGAAAPTVRITAEGFLPSDLAVKTGTAVTWVNDDTIARTVSADEQHAAPVTEPEDAAFAANRTGEASGNATPAPGLLAVYAAVAAAAVVLARARR